MPKIGKPVPTSGASVEGALMRTGACVFRVGQALKSLPTRFFRRDALPIGVAVAGPAIVLQMDSTTVVPPGATFTADPCGNLMIRLGELP